MANILRAIFGHNYSDIPNKIPATIGITSAGMLAFFLFWLIHLFFCPFRPYQLRNFFWFKVRAGFSHLQSATSLTNDRELS